MLFTSPIQKKSCYVCFVALLLIALFSESPAMADPLRIDFDRSNNGVTDLQTGWEAFSADGGGLTTNLYANDELAGIGNSVSIGLSGPCCYRDYAEAIGIFAPSSNLLRDGPLLNGPGTMTLDISGLLAGTYMINTYHHTTQFGQAGPNARPPATPFDINLTDSAVINSSIATGLIVSDNTSLAVNMQTFSFQVTGAASTVSIDFVRGASNGPDDHFALPGIEIYTPGNPPPPIELTFPDPPVTNILKVDFKSESGQGGGPSGRQSEFYEFEGDNLVGGSPNSATDSFVFDHGIGAGGTVDVTLSGAADTVADPSGVFVYRNYAVATGIYEDQSPLLSDGPLLNGPGTITLKLENLADGTYEITTYHHTTQNGPTPRPPATPFNINLTDGLVTDEEVIDNVLMSDNASGALSTQTFQFTVDNGSAVEIDFIRGLGLGEGVFADDHFALPGFELSFVGTPGCTYDGDYNCDDKVDEDDIATILQGYGADFDLTDVLEIKKHFGEVNGFPPLAPEPNTVPEPSSLFLLAFGFLFGVMVIMKKRKLRQSLIYVHKN